MAVQSKHLKDEYAVIDPNGKSKTWKADDFWQMVFNPGHPENRPELGYLVSQFDFESDWTSWECHPHGDEIVFCISGSMTFVIERPSNNQEVELIAGEYLVVPKDTWHTAKVSQPCKALFITWGYGTKHRDK